MIKILFGKFPYTGWKIPHELSGKGYEQFKNIAAAQEVFKPDYFLVESQQSARQEVKDYATKILGGTYYDFDSNLVSAQCRPSFYITNIPNVQIPTEQSPLVVADIINPHAKGLFRPFEHEDTKEPSPTGIIRLGRRNNYHQTRIYSIRGKAAALKKSKGSMDDRTGLYYIKGKGARKLSIGEARALQTIPRWVSFPTAKTRTYDLLGEAWTIDVIKTFIRAIPNYESEEFVVVSMYDGIGCGFITLKDLKCRIKTYVSVEPEKRSNWVLDANIPNRLGFKNPYDILDSESELYSTILKVRN